MKPILCMIVKNEALVIERCLASVRPYVSAYAIVDTGSTDGTQDIIRAFMADLPGKVVNREWVNFSTARNQALDLADEFAHISSWRFMMDADAVLCDAPCHWTEDWSELANDATQYSFPVRLGNCHYSHSLLSRCKSKWRFVGAVHEYMEGFGEQAGFLATPAYVIYHTDGARSKDDARWIKDRDMLLEEWKVKQDPRTLFYLARTYECMGDHGRAYIYHRQRANMKTGFMSEAYISLLTIAQYRQNVGESMWDIIGDYERAYNISPHRAEAPHLAARMLRNGGACACAAAWARRGVGLPVPVWELFVEHDVYEWRCKDELAVAAYWLGQYQLCYDLCKQIIGCQSIPEHDVARIQKNIQFSTDHGAKPCQ